MLGSSLAAAAAAAASAAAPLASALPIQVVGSQLQSAAAAGECPSSTLVLPSGPKGMHFRMERPEPVIYTAG
jgi:hypothetical protein